jgi:hypothetical protein
VDPGLPLHGAERFGRTAPSERFGFTRKASVSYRCHMNGAKSGEKANKKRKEKENLINRM